jgi:hypothetical protein
MTIATARPYRHLLEILDEVTRPSPPPSATTSEDIA